MRARFLLCSMVLLGGCAEEWFLPDEPPFFGGRFPLGDAGFDPAPGPGFVEVDAGVPPDPRVELGQALFFDPLLSGNRNISCATCHVPFLATAEGLPISLGEGASGLGPNRVRGDGTILPRHTQDLFHRDVPDASALFWDGRVERLPSGELRGPTEIPEGVQTPLELASIVPLLDRDEMRGQPGDAGNELAAFADEEALAIWQAIVDRIDRTDAYGPLIERAGQPAATIGLVAQALAAFQRDHWGPFDTRWDRGRLTAPEARGRRIFFGDGGCDRCHGGEGFSDFAFHNIGVPPVGPGFDGEVDEGRARVTGRREDRFAFRTPPLRNVRLTPPYMHDGAFATLEEAIRHHLDPTASLLAYDGGSLPPSLRATLRPELAPEILATLDPEVVPLRPLSDDEIDALVAFLGALDSEAELTKPPGSGVPDAVPSGLPVDRWSGGPHPFR